MAKKVTTVSEVVNKLGGRSAVADRYSVTYNAVSNWCSWNRFPPRLHLPLSRECAKAKIRLPDELFEHRDDPTPAEPSPRHHHSTEAAE